MNRSTTFGRKPRVVKEIGAQFSNIESQKMSQEPEKKHILIYLVSIIHWIGAGSVIGLLYSFGVLPPIAIFSLIVLCFFVLPPIIRVVDGDELDEQ